MGGGVVNVPFALPAAAAKRRRGSRRSTSFTSGPPGRSARHVGESGCQATTNRRRGRSNGLGQPLLSRNRLPGVTFGQALQCGRGGLMAPKIAYWASTIIAAVMLGFALSYLTGNEQVVTGFKHLGYPQHPRLVLRVANPAAGVVLLLPGLRLLKEWADAGAAFAWSAAAGGPWR